MRRAAFLVGTVSLAIGVRGLAGDAFARADHRSPAATNAFVPTPRSLVLESAARREEGPATAWAARLEDLEVTNRTTRERARLRLYDVHGELDAQETEHFMRVAEREHDATSGAVEHLDLRLVRLVARAAYHFGRSSCLKHRRGDCDGASASVVIVSATRASSRGKHASGEALDFFLEGVRASTLAAYLRSYPRAGVGIYTHPRTQYVHLDVRDQSFHWLDASPPGKTWRERPIRDPKRVVRDARWDPEDDLPEVSF